MNNKKSNNSNPQSPEALMKRKSWALKSHHNITLQEYDHWLNEVQQGLCPVCLSPAPSLFEMAVANRFWPVDHSHGCCQTKPFCGKCVRGIVCYMCNAALTAIWEDPEWRERALAYLKVD